MAGKGYNLSVYTFYNQNTQYIYDRSSKTCHKQASPPFNTGWPTNATVMGRTRVGNQPADFVRFVDPTYPNTNIDTLLSECTPIRVGFYNTTDHALYIEEHIFNWDLSVNPDVFQDLPDACNHNKVMALPEEKRWMVPNIPLIF